MISSVVTRVAVSFCHNEKLNSLLFLSFVSVQLYFFIKNIGVRKRRKLTSQNYFPTSYCSLPSTKNSSPLFSVVWVSRKVSLEIQQARDILSPFTMWILHADYTLCSMKLSLRNNDYVHTFRDWKKRQEVWSVNNMHNEVHIWVTLITKSSVNEWK